MKLTTALILATALVSASAANAMTVTYTSNTHLTSPTNWADTLNFTKFDPSLGTLTSIFVTLNGNITGTAKAESEDDAAATLVLTLASTITLTRPDNTTIVIVSPGILNSFAATGYDGNTDFAGTSGISYTNQSANLSNSATLTSAADLALFTGIGTLAAPTTGKGSSNASGAGNVVSSFHTQAGAGGTVTYTFTTGVPEPTSWALMLVGLGMVGVAARRRKTGTVAA